jgi:hypothetical protein
MHVCSAWVRGVERAGEAGRGEGEERERERE